MYVFFCFFLLMDSLGYETPITTIESVTFFSFFIGILWKDCLYKTTANKLLFIIICLSKSVLVKVKKPKRGKCFVCSTTLKEPKLS